MLFQSSVRHNVRKVFGRHKDSDFPLSHLLRARLMSIAVERKAKLKQSNVVPVMPAEEKASIDAAPRSYRYWCDEPSCSKSEAGGELCFWSENHAILFMHIEYLSGRMMPHMRFASGLTGLDHAKRAGVRMRSWLRMRLRTGFAEFNSPVYTPMTLSGLLSMVDFALDPALHPTDDMEELHRMAVQATDILMLDIVRLAHRSAFRGAAGRKGPDKFRQGDPGQGHRSGRDQIGHAGPAGGQDRP